MKALGTRIFWRDVREGQISFFGDCLSFFVVIFILLMFSNGCVTSLNKTPAEKEKLVKEDSDQKQVKSDAKLIKPSIVDDKLPGKNGEEKKEPDAVKHIRGASQDNEKIGERSKSEARAQKSSNEKSGEVARKKIPRQLEIPEIDKVKNAAREMGKNMSSVEKIKICLMKSTDEFWVTFYDDIGSLIDLKQFIWEAESESLTPFLVLKRIPKSRLETHMTVVEADKECVVIENSGRRKTDDKSEGKGPQSDNGKQ